MRAMSDYSMSKLDWLRKEERTKRCAQVYKGRVKGANEVLAVRGENGHREAGGLGWYMLDVVGRGGEGDVTLRGLRSDSRADQPSEENEGQSGHEL